MFYGEDVNINHQGKLTRVTFWKKFFPKSNFPNPSCCLAKKSGREMIVYRCFIIIFKTVSLDLLDVQFTYWFLYQFNDIPFILKTKAMSLKQLHLIKKKRHSLLNCYKKIILINNTSSCFFFISIIVFIKMIIHERTYT